MTEEIIDPTKQPEQELELRMYFFVPYNISEIAKSIQAGHGALRFVLKYGRHDPNHMIWDFIERHETWVVLNGGTTNDELDFDNVPQGSLNQIGDGLNENNIEFAYFREPDLNNSLTALCFIADERVFNKKDYPDFKDFLFNVSVIDGRFDNNAAFEDMQFDIANMSHEMLTEKYDSDYKSWVRLVGGMKNVFLRQLLKDKRLA